MADAEWMQTAPSGAWFPSLAVSCARQNGSDSCPPCAVYALALQNLQGWRCQRWANVKSDHSDAAWGVLPGGMPPPLIFDRKFVEITVQTGLPRDAVPLHTNCPLRELRPRTPQTWQNQFCAPCLFRLQAAATALINEEMFGNRAPFFHRIVCGKPPSATVTHTHAKARWIYWFL